jgi:hypothetical protein
MAANPNWARWIFASLADYLKTVATDNEIKALIEGVDDRTDDIMQAVEHVEIAITGPFSREMSRNYYELKVGVRVLIQARMDNPPQNRYSPQRIAGLYHEAMDAVIAVYKYGSNPGDDNSLLGCLSPLKGRNDAIRVFHFGQLTPTDRLRQSMVDAWYVIELTNNN